MNLTRDLSDLAARGNLALFIGGDLPQALTGLPSRADLAAGLAQRLGLTGPPPPWPEVAARYEAEAGLNALIRWLRDRLEAEHRPAPLYRLLAQLPVDLFITTTYDRYLHLSLMETGRRPNLPVVDASSLGLLDTRSPTAVKLFGVYDQPSSLVLTAAHLQQLPQAKAQILAGLIHPTLANKSVLILGQDLRDTYFQAIYRNALFQASPIRPPAYAVWAGLDEWEKQTWLQQEVRVIEIPAMDLVGELVDALQTTPDAVSPTDLPEEAAARPVETSKPEMPAIDPDNPPIAAIRDLLEAAFAPETLKQFCQDRPDFRPLVARFSPNDGLTDMVERVIVYCGEVLLWDALLAEVKEERPRQFARFEPGL